MNNQPAKIKLGGGNLGGILTTMDMMCKECKRKHQLGGHRADISEQNLVEIRNVVAKTTRGVLAIMTNSKPRTRLEVEEKLGHVRETCD